MLGTARIWAKRRRLCERKGGGGEERVFNHRCIHSISNIHGKTLAEIMRSCNSFWFRFRCFVHFDFFRLVAMIISGSKGTL